MKRVIIFILMLALCCQMSALAETGWKEYNGIQFLGGDRADVPNGLVVLIDEAMGSVYIGFCQSGVKSGEGFLWEQTDEGNSLYIGPFLKDQENGNGTFYRPDDSWYEGLYRDGVLDGNGWYQKDGVVYEARFDHNELVEILEPMMAIPQRTAKNVRNEDGTWMIGEFVGNVLDNRGVSIDADGNVCIGIFMMGKFQSGRTDSLMQNELQNLPADTP